MLLVMLSDEIGPRVKGALRAENGPREIRDALPADAFAPLVAVTSASLGDFVMLIEGARVSVGGTLHP